MATPKYRATAKLFLNNGLIVEGQDFEFDGIPNYAMTPLNQEAKDALEAYYVEHPTAIGADPIASLPMKIDPKDAVIKPAPKAPAPASTPGKPTL